MLTKPLKVGNVFNDNGVFKFVLQEVTSTSNDNQELGIADYYSHFLGASIVNPEADREGWL